MMNAKELKELFDSFFIGNTEDVLRGTKDGLWEWIEKNFTPNERLLDELPHERVVKPKIAEGELHNCICGRKLEVINDEMYEYANDEEGYIIICDCGIRANYFKRTKEQAIKKWNSNFSE